MNWILIMIEVMFWSMIGGLAGGLTAHVIWKKCILRKSNEWQKNR